MTDPHREQTGSPQQQPWSPAPGPAPTPPPTPDRPAHRADSSTGQQGETSTGQQAGAAAQDVAHDAREAGHAVADTARSETADVKDDAVREGRRLWDETASTLSSQASDQMNRAAETVRGVSDDLGRMGRGEEPTSDMTKDLVHQATERTSSVAGWLEGHEPGDLLTEVKSFARRRPVAFLGIAAGIGFMAGRLTRGTAQSHMDDGGSDSGSSTALTERPTGQVPVTGQVPPPPRGAPTAAPAAPGAAVPGAAPPVDPEADLTRTPVGPPSAEPPVPGTPRPVDGRGEHR